MKFGKGGKMLTLNKSKFNANSLESFSKVFPTVCYDGAYYQVPNTKTLETLESQVPDDFKMTFKCTEKFTQRRHDVKKGGDGSLNSSYLRPERFGEEYLAPIQDIFKSKLGTIIFEFSPFFFE